MSHTKYYIVQLLCLQLFYRYLLSIYCLTDLFEKLCKIQTDMSMIMILLRCRYYYTRDTPEIQYTCPYHVLSLLMLQRRVIQQRATIMHAHCLIFIFRACTTSMT
uniref:Uncharacterized protein n=1 Tax=Schizaphis graminum TaxID=13262 RepID=A0A2S2P2U3_SCHGA